MRCVAVSTHDLPTFAGWWWGAISTGASASACSARACATPRLGARVADRRRLLDALTAAGLAPADADAEVSPPSPRAARGRPAYLAATPCAVMVVQLEDAVRGVEQANVPGTTHEHPNWRRKLPCDLDAIAADEGVRHLAARWPTAAGVRRSRRPSPAAVEANVPRATYRLQLHHDFTLRRRARACCRISRGSA